VYVCLRFRIIYTFSAEIVNVIVRMYRFGAHGPHLLMCYMLYTKLVMTFPLDMQHINMLMPCVYHCSLKRNVDLFYRPFLGDPADYLTANQLRVLCMDICDVSSPG
jgi:hypothetical protein